ncbi:metalloregulator ArsR/SmtB family transcription factor [Cryobacterium sp. N22]|uniref:helix-turn-helix transcriptional regulator n=1 Tax=Cryobacterium sp. N22 TaxID=2048290 RepID=UPI000CE4C040|nr:helix-turn-helix domain-containing protein [Cryobacterium sp. N22]
MVSTDQSDARHAALASEPRRRVLGLLTAAAGPLDAVTVAAGIGLHVTTARFHLEQLEAAGLVERRVARAGQRGRPHVLFSPVAAPLPAEDAQQQLTQALASVIGEDADGGRARSVRAGERWSAQYPAVADADAPPGATGGASATGEPGTGIVPPLLRVLTEIGFEPQLRADENTIALPACPFRAEARQNPDVVCSVHLGLIKGLVRERGHDASGIRLLPFVQPHLCLVELPPGLAN